MCPFIVASPPIYEISSQVSSGQCGQCYAWSLLPASLQAVERDAVFVGAEFCIEPTAGPATGFKKNAATFALSKLDIRCQSLPKLQPERIQQRCRTKLPLQRALANGSQTTFAFSELL